MRDRRVLVLGSLSCIGLLVAMVSCLSDPREGEDVVVQETCARDSLSTEPSSPESSLRAYVESTSLLATRAQAVESALRDVCNEIDTELGLAKGVDAPTACAPISARIAEIFANEPKAPPTAFVVTHFAQIAFPETCTVPPGTLESCLAKCAGPCDTSRCEPGKLAGRCEGECLGSCSETGDPVPCVGSCAGESAIDGSCFGECEGTCAAPFWTGTCTGSCPAGFVGFCAGTCTGRCDGSLINGGLPDAGADGGDPDGGEGGAPPPPAGSQKPPGGDDGNCRGTCDGVCSSGASGVCNGLCRTFDDGGPPFGKMNGFCGVAAFPAPNCSGTCRSAAGSGTLTTCRGTCTSTKPQCAGTCRVVNGQGCNGTLSDTFCEGNVACGQNSECNNACQATAALAATCTEPLVAELYTASAPALQAALKARAGRLGKLLQELAQVRKAEQFIGARGLGDFRVIGLSGDLVRACVAEGRANVERARKSIEASVRADPTVRRTQ